MKLLVVSTWFPYPPDNGSRIRAFRLIEQLARRHRLSLLTFADAGEASPSLGGLETSCERVSVIRWPITRRARPGWRGLLTPTPRAYAQRYSEEMAAEVSSVHGTHDAGLALQIDAAPYLADIRTIPRVLEELEVGVHLDRIAQAPTAPRRWRARLTWAKMRRYVRDLHDRFDRVTVASTVERAHLLAIGCDAAKISVVVNAAPAPLPPRPPSRDRNTLVYPGAVTYDANADAVGYFAREVLPRLRRERPDLELVVTGATGGRDRELAAPGVRFTGHLEEVRSVLRGALACVVPLREGGGTRIKVLEALACGVPVVTTTKGIEGLNLADGREVLVANSPDAFAVQIGRLLDDRDLEAALTRRGLDAVVRQHTWEASGRALESALDAAVSAHGGRVAAIGASP
jgi:glycosyltransferase involved in cell wall biosynthesis